MVYILLLQYKSKLNNHVYSVVSESLRPHGLQPAMLVCSWDLPGKNTRVGCHFLLHGIFPRKELKPHLASPPLAGGFFTTVSPLYNHVLIKNILTLNVFDFTKTSHFLHKRDYNENSQNGISFLLQLQGNRHMHVIIIS